MSDLKCANSAIVFTEEFAADAIEPWAYLSHRTMKYLSDCGEIVGDVTWWCENPPWNPMFGPVPAYLERSHVLRAMCFVSIDKSPA